MRTLSIKVVPKAAFCTRTVSGMSSDVTGCRVSIFGGSSEGRAAMMVINIYIVNQSRSVFSCCPILILHTSATR